MPAKTTVRNVKDNSIISEVNPDKSIKKLFIPHETQFGLSDSQFPGSVTVTGSLGISQTISGDTRPALHLTGSGIKVSLGVGDDQKGLFINSEDTGSTLALEVNSKAAVYAAAIAGKLGLSVTQSASNGTGLYVARGITEAGVLPVARFEDLSTSNTQTTVAIKQRGTGDILNLLDDTTEVFTVLDGGNVGIGSEDPVARLEVGAGHSSTVALENILIACDGGDDAALDLIEETGDSSGFGTAYAFGVRLVYDGGDNNLYIKSGYGVQTRTLMTIEGGLTGGKVGIGASSPAVALHVTSSATADSVTEVLRVEESDENSSENLTTGNGAAIAFYVAEDTGSGLGARIIAQRESNTDTNTSAGLAFWTYGDNASGGERMRIDNSGKVGIGTTSPEGMLSIYGDGDVTGVPGIYLDGYDDSELDISVPTGQVMQFGEWSGSSATLNAKIAANGDFYTNDGTVQQPF